MQVGTGYHLPRIALLRGRDGALVRWRVRLAGGVSRTPQRILTREQLIDLAHGQGHEAFDRSIDVQVSRLRRKIEPDSKRPELIRTVRNGGYLFTAKVTRS